jgi:hypothetical protein
MEGQQIKEQADQIADLLKKNDVKGASDALQKDTMGMYSGDLLKLIAQTNMATANTGADQLVFTTNANGFPMVEFTNLQKTVDTSVPVNVNNDAPATQAAAPKEKDCTNSTVGGAAIGYLIFGGPVAVGLGALIGHDHCKSN